MKGISTKNLKTIGCLVLCALILVIQPLIAHTNTQLPSNLQTLQLRIDGSFLDTSEGQQPIIDNANVLIPLRTVMEALGFYVEWGYQLRTVSVTMPEHVVLLQIGCYDAYIGRTVQRLDTIKIYKSEK